MRGVDKITSLAVLRFAPLPYPILAGFLELGSAGTLTFFGD